MDTSEASAPVIPSPKTMSPRLQIVFVAGAFLLLLAIVAWSMGVASDKRAQNVHKRSFDALSEAIVPLLLDRNPSKLKTRITLIAQAGGYAEITVTDPKGFVLASTTSTQTNQQISFPTPLPATTSLNSNGSDQIYDRVITLPGENTLGVLRVIVRD